MTENLRNLTNGWFSLNQLGLFPPSLFCFASISCGYMLVQKEDDEVRKSASTENKILSDWMESAGIP